MKPARSYFTSKAGHCITKDAKALGSRHAPIVKADARVDTSSFAKATLHARIQLTSIERSS